MVEADSTEKLKVFISYSRRDSSEFAEELLTGLELAGFAPFLDRHDIAPGEPWEARLDGLIRQADTVVYVISAAAVKSERCEWEVETAVALAKRIIPIVYRPVVDHEIPEQLRHRQYVRFDMSAGITRPLSQLADALRQDLAWIREHTRLSELAARWQARGHPETLLLRGDELTDVKAWSERRRPGAPSVTQPLNSFIAASKQAETAYLAKSRAARRYLRIVVGASTFLCLFAVSAGIAAWWNHDWLHQEFYVLKNVHSLSVAQELALKSGDHFNECAHCPEMVVIPAGSFMMGLPDKEGGESDHPQHNVTLAKSFAVSKYELMFAEWDECGIRGGCNAHILDNRWGRGRQPVINVSWEEALEYAAWVSTITGKTYRLLSESEYEYAARAGTTTKYPWGDNIGYNNANCYGCGRKLDMSRTMLVGSFQPNKFGLFDMVGNVWEWTEDCEIVSYNGAPTDGSARTSIGDCSKRAVRGGAWDDDPTSILSTSREWFDTHALGNRVGFRVARMLNTR